MQLFRRSHIHCFAFFIRQESSDFFLPCSLSYGTLDKYFTNILKLDPVNILKQMDVFTTGGVQGQSHLHIHICLLSFYSACGGQR
jgi:hypothetical protein